LIFHQRHFRKTHNIAELVELCKEINPQFDQLYTFEVENLTPYATEIRYPEDFYFPSREEGIRAIKNVEEVKVFILKKLRDEGL
jgi:hypothetical protein